MTGPAVLLLGLGLVCVLEGLVLALAPSRIEELLDFLRRLPTETRRTIGICALTLGVTLIWLAARIGG